MNIFKIKSSTNADQVNLILGARSMEASEMQATRMEGDQRVEINSIGSRGWKGKKRENNYNSKQGQKCYQ